MPACPSKLKASHCVCCTLKSPAVLGLGLVLSAFGVAHHGQAQERSIEALLQRSAARQLQRSAARQQEEPTGQLQDQDETQELVTEETQTQQNSTLENQKQIRLSLRPTISIPEVTVPEFEGISVGGISAMDIDDRRNAIYWWNDTVARQVTRLLSRMIVQSGDVSVRDIEDAKYILLAEVTSYKEIEEESKGGGVNFLIFGTRGGSNKVESAITLNARIIDTLTDDVIHETSIRGTAQAEARGGGGFVNLGIVKFEGDQSKQNVDPPIEEAIQVTLEKTTDYVHCALVNKDSCLREYDTLQFKL